MNHHTNSVVLCGFLEDCKRASCTFAHDEQHWNKSTKRILPSTYKVTPCRFPSNLCPLKINCSSLHADEMFFPRNAQGVAFVVTPKVAMRIKWISDDSAETLILQTPLLTSLPDGPPITEEILKMCPALGQFDPTRKIVYPTSASVDEDRNPLDRMKHSVIKDRSTESKKLLCSFMNRCRYRTTTCDLAHSFEEVCSFEEAVHDPNLFVPCNFLLITHIFTFL